LSFEGKKRKYLTHPADFVTRINVVKAAKTHQIKNFESRKGGTPLKFVFLPIIERLFEF
jgi:hypothetical protein